MSKLNFRVNKKAFRRRILSTSWSLLGSAFLLSTPVGAVNSGDTVTPDKIKKANTHRKKIKSAINTGWNILVLICAFCLPSPIFNRKNP